MNFEDRIRLYNKENFALMYPKYNLFHLANNLQKGVTSCITNALSIIDSFTDTDPEILEITEKMNVMDIVKPNRIYHVIRSNDFFVYPHHVCYAYYEGKYYEIESFLNINTIEVDELTEKKFIKYFQKYLDHPILCKEFNASVTIHSCKIDDHETVLQNIEKNIQEFLANANDEDKAKYLEIHEKVQELLGSDLTFDHNLIQVFLGTNIVV